MALEFTAAVRRIPAYPAAAGYGHEGSLVRLASNESPDPPLPEVIAAASAAVADVNRYPDPTNARLRAALSDRYGVPAENIAVGNGSCELLMSACDALLEPGAEVVYGWPSFSIYPQLAASAGASAIEVPLDGEERLDLDAMAREITVATRLVIACNPNNPTSTALAFESLAAFAERVPPSVCLFFDEAYCDFNLLTDPDATVDLLAKHPNLVLLRTFSKVHGLAGLRVGFALCGSRELPDAVTQLRQPFFLNAAAGAAAIESLRHLDEVARRVERVAVARVQVIEGLRDLGLEPADSQANFCWFDVGEGREEAQIVHGLAEAGVLVRAGGALGKDGALRVTFGTPRENERFLEALATLL
ncbi:MAG TPA: aminotransferase class I/II-fold pyridoxal phosphate-dependent enzyme [Solirubrobacteraceae bacterium]|nr:aminotransferase class I/II-fold pyridoxal phosphate-dependent enzyme [Solirubrobacteraceae bacterium]